MPTRQEAIRLRDACVPVMALAAEVRNYTARNIELRVNLTDDEWLAEKEAKIDAACAALLDELASVIATIREEDAEREALDAAVERGSLHPHVANGRVF